MRRSEEPPMVVDMAPGFGPHRRPLAITCGISPKFGSTSGDFGATHRLERKHHAPRKEVAHV
jgi:hypothetical protein